MLEVKTLDKPDERRDFPRGHLEAVHMTGLDFAVATFEPGWRWSESVGPIAMPEDAKYILERSPRCHGFYGASSMERLPVETALGANTRDLPFTLTYLLDPEHRRVHRFCATAIPLGHPAALPEIDLARGDSGWPLRSVLTRYQ